VISLTCALLATLLQRWARRYLDITQKWNDPQKRAQTRELMWQALGKQVHFSWMVELLPFLLHTSVFLFLVGFVVYLLTFNHLVAGLVAGCAGISLISYLYLSLAPIFPCSRDSPYSTPLTPVVWAITMFITSLFLRFCHFVAKLFRPKDAGRFWNSYQRYQQRILKGTTVDIEKLATTPPSGLATSVLSSTFDSLGGDSDIEQFLTCIPGFYASDSAQRHFDKATFAEFNLNALPSSIISYMDRVLSSNLLSSSEMQKRVKMCMEAINADPDLPQYTFGKALQALPSDVFGCAEFVSLALEHLDDSNTWVKDFTRCIVAIAFNHAHLDNNTRSDITKRHLKSHHARYLSDGHNAQLCNLICLIQYLKLDLLQYSDQFQPGGVWHNVLSALADPLKLQIMNTADDLQNEFCDELKNLRSLASSANPGAKMTQPNAKFILSCISTAFASSTDRRGPVLQLLDLYPDWCKPEFTATNMRKWWRH
jgi:hypothetical protein